MEDTGKSQFWWVVVLETSSSKGLSGLINVLARIELLVICRDRKRNPSGDAPLLGLHLRSDREGTRDQ
jgi:hypothetical protein